MMKNILFFGDSLTAGYGLTDVTNQAFPGLIQQKINAAGLNYKVINAGVSGDTTRGGLARLDYWLSQPVDIFILELGINDAIRGVTPATIKQNLQLIINKVRAKYPEVKIALMGMQLPEFIPGRQIAEFSHIFSALAADNSIALVPFF
ncbi:GDSL-type esterase/lipase family protein [Mucilaginibacter antarcticus]